MTETKPATPETKPEAPKFRENSEFAFREWSAEQPSIEWFARSGPRIKFNVARPAGVTDQQFAAMLHGYKQTIADTAAKPCDTKTGKSTPAERKIAAMIARRDFLVGAAAVSGDGAWVAAAKAATGPRIDADLIEACTIKFAKPAEKILAWLSAMDATKRDAIAALPEVAKLIDGARQRRVADVDTAALIAGLPE